MKRSLIALLMLTALPVAAKSSIHHVTIEYTVSTDSAPVLEVTKAGAIVYHANPNDVVKYLLVRLQDMQKSEQQYKTNVENDYNAQFHTFVQNLLAENKQLKEELNSRLDKEIKQYCEVKK